MSGDPDQVLNNQDVITAYWEKSFDWRGYMALLKVSDLKVNYEVIQAIKGISFEINSGEVIALIGANGTGKTTILNGITGLVPIKSGNIEFAVGDDEYVDLTKIPAQNCFLGMAMFLRAGGSFLS